MKNIRIKTEKVTFYLIDMPKDTKEVQNIYLNGISWQSRDGHWDTWYSEDESETLTFVSFLKDISEEQASEIVDDSFNAYNEHSFKHYEDGVFSGSYIVTAIESLHSLLKSKGMHLYKNPNPRRYIMAMTDKGIIDTTEKIYLEAEEKTFYNPAIYAVAN